MQLHEFQAAALHFLDLLFKDLSLKQIDIPDHWEIDHICYRVDSRTSYEKFKTDFSQFGKLLVESEVNGRPIATFKLNQSISFKNHRIDVVELPAPKASKKTLEGFEHVEVVCDSSFAELEKKFQHLELDRGGLTKDFNAELEIVLGARNLKFHQLSLESVVAMELHPQAFKALNDSGILWKFKKYQPLVAGTFPLRLNVENSDLDILLCSQDLDALGQELQESWGDVPGFQLRRQWVDGLESLIATFVFDGVPFEVFAQDKITVRQKAYRHFQVEEKILRRGGEALREKIMKLREQGVKTEPAFAQVLGLAGDPYEALLNYRPEL